MTVSSGYENKGYDGDNPVKVGIKIVSASISNPKKSIYSFFLCVFFPLEHRSLRIEIQRILYR